MSRRETYKIEPGMYLGYTLFMRRGWGIFADWKLVAADDDFDALAERVRKCGGVLLNLPTPSPQ